jgi:hypothetical protein
MRAEMISTDEHWLNNALFLPFFFSTDHHRFEHLQQLDIRTVQSQIGRGFLGLSSVWSGLLET